MTAPQAQASPAPDTGRPAHHTSWKRALAELPLLVAVALVVAFILKALIAQAFYIPSGSMEPQLQVGDRVLVSKLAYKLHDPRRGDIVVFPSPEDPDGDDDPVLPLRLLYDALEGVGLREPPDDMLIKRIIALPGETVEGKAGHIYINGQPLVEPYLEPTVVTPDFPATPIPDGKVWVMGDNRSASHDSKIFGPIERSSIVGRAIVRAWPPWDTSFL